MSTQSLDHPVARVDRQSTQSAADSITTEIVRCALNSAAMQMKRAMIRTSFSPIIYETLDFAVVLYDRYVRLLAQAPTLPAFMGTMSFCIEAAVSAVGGESALNPGDVLVYNRPYGTGSHAQDCAIVMPVFLESGALIGYAANKAHWLDIGAKAPYCTDTTDVFQEGVVIPGVKLYDNGVLREDIRRMILANCRFQRAVSGDINAQVASCHVGARELRRVIERFTYSTFTASVERMLDHGEHVIREFVKSLPQGTFKGMCHMDNNGVDDTPIKFEVAVTVNGSDLEVDFSKAPPAQRGPVNCPWPSTVSAARIALAMASGAHETPNDGHFRPLKVLAPKGSMFYPVEPQPCYLYGWSLSSAMEGIFEALSKATGARLPSGSAGDLCAVLYYGTDKASGDMFFGGTSLPVGQGASLHGDGATMYLAALAHSQTQSPELQEAKTPVRYEKWEFTENSAGPGRFRGGSGWEVHYRVLQDVALISVMERTKIPGWGQLGGLSGHPNRFELHFPDGHIELILKATDLLAPAGSLLKIFCGGGGGYGSPSERAPEAVTRDLLYGLITVKHAEEFYGHVL